MSDDHQHGHQQRLETHLRDIDRRGSVVAGLETDAIAKKQMADTFGDKPAMVIVYQGVHHRLTQPEIAEELAARGLPGASQPSVSRAVAKLERQWFLRRPKKGRVVVREGWDEFGLDRELKQILKKHEVPKLG